MAHLLSIENWIRLAGSTSGVLPEGIRRMGHPFTLATSHIDIHRCSKHADARALDNHPGARL